MKVSKIQTLQCGSSSLSFAVPEFYPMVKSKGTMGVIQEHECVDLNGSEHKTFKTNAVALKNNTSMSLPIFVLDKIRVSHGLCQGLPRMVTSYLPIGQIACFYMNTVYYIVIDKKLSKSLI